MYSCFNLVCIVGCQALVLSMMGIVGSNYRYTEDLLALDRYRPQHPVITWPRGPTPIWVTALLPYMRLHPDQRFAEYVFNGLCFGFRIGHDSHSSLVPSNRNHPSALEHRHIVHSHITGELSKGSLLGPLPVNQEGMVHTSPLGLVPKPNTDKFRLIVDLSSPSGASVNDGIAPEFCSLMYASIDQAADIILRLGRGTQLLKFDLKDAYRVIPVHPQDHHLLVIKWQNGVFIDRSLPFELRSAPKIFTAFADMVAWAIHCGGVRYLLHYLDDFLIFGAPLSEEATVAASQASEFLTLANIPIASHKTEGPTTCLTFLEILLDTDQLQLRLPADKVSRLKGLLEVWQSQKSCTRKELESFTGHLAHAAMVIRQGRIFLRSLFSLLSATAKQHFYIRLNISVRADLRWWHHFLQTWNGSSFLPLPVPSHHVYSDASGNFGCGAFCDRIGWFQEQWPPSWSLIDIAPKELLPIVIAAALWGHLWTGSHVCFHSDNMAVVAVLAKRTANDPLLIQLLCYFYSAYHGFHYTAVHIPGSLNIAADALSRGVIHDFTSFIPQITLTSTTVPSLVRDTLINKTPDWLWDNWTRLFTASLTTASLLPQ